MSTPPAERDSTLRPSAGAAPLRILFVGDLHLGRLPTRLPAGLDARALSPRRAWQSCVDEALRRSVNAVVLAGDVVDQPEDRFEALPPVEEGVQQLARAGIPTVAVVGNHDVEALPRLAARLPELTLLGAGGRWQACLLGSGESRAILCGWSFPQARVPGSPLDSFDPAALELVELPVGAPGSSPHEHVEPGTVAREAGVPLLGVLHCDLGARSSYAPVARGALEAAPVDAWFLGHIHTPDALCGPRPIGYLGSASSLDPGEVGPRGPWLAAVHGPGQVEVEHLPLAPLRYERLAIPVDGIGEGSRQDLEDELHRVVAEALGVRAEELAGDPDSAALQVVAVRAALVGRHRAGAAVREFARGATADASEVRRHGLTVFLESAVDETRTAHDLSELAIGSDPIGLLARRLLLLEGGAAGGRDAENGLVGEDGRDPASAACHSPGGRSDSSRANPAREPLAALLDDAAVALERRARDSRWSALEPVALGREEVRRRLLAAGYALLDRMLEQQRAFIAEGTAVS